MNNTGAGGEDIDEPEEMEGMEGFFCFANCLQEINCSNFNDAVTNSINYFLYMPVHSYKLGGSRSRKSRREGGLGF